MEQKHCQVFKFQLNNQPLDPVIEIQETFFVNNTIRQEGINLFIGNW